MMDHVIFSHHGANGPKSNTTFFRRLRQMAVSGAKCDVYDCVALTISARSQSNNNDG